MNNTIFVKLMNNTNNLFKKVREQIEYRQQRKREGKVNAIPYNFPKLSTVIPGVMPELFVASTSISGGGKTIIDQELHIHGPYKFWKKYKDEKDIDIQIFAFPLEDSVEITQKRFLIKELYNRYGDRIGMFDLDGVMGGGLLSDDTNRRIDSLEPHFEEFYSKVMLIDDVTNPTGIFKRVESWLLRPENGYIVDEHGNKLNPEEVKEAHNPHAENHRPTFYRRTNPNRIDIITIDNMQNITEEKGCNTKWDALDLLCRVYLRKKLVNYYKCFVSMISQQDKGKERAQYTNSGGIVEDKFVPSLDSVSIYKNLDTSVHLFFSIFDPSRYKIPSWNSGGGYYNIERLDTYYRQFSILKSNFAQVGTSTSFFFDGVSGNIQELPRANELEVMEYWYQRAEELQRNKGGYKALNIAA